MALCWIGSIFTRKYPICLLMTCFAHPRARPASTCAHVARKHARALTRQGKTNQALAGQEIDLFAPIDAVTSQLLRTVAARLGWSARGVHRTLKVARTIADLAGSEEIALVHVAEAMQYRHSGPNAR